MSYVTADIVDYMRDQVHQISTNPKGKKRGRCVRSERDPITTPEANTCDKLVQAADVAPGVKRFRR